MRDGLDVDVAAGRVAIGADLFVRLLAKVWGSAVGRFGSVTSSATARPKPPFSRGPIETAHFHRRFRRVLLVLLGDMIERAAESGG